MTMLLVFIVERLLSSAVYISMQSSIVINYIGGMFEVYSMQFSPVRPSCSVRLVERLSVFGGDACNLEQTNF